MRESSGREGQFCVVVHADETNNPDFVRDVRNLAYLLNRSASEFIDLILTDMAFLDVTFTDGSGNEIEINTDCFDINVSGLDEYTAEAAEAAHRERLRLWCRDTFCKPCSHTIRPHVRAEVLPMFLIIASVLKACHPEEAARWGRTSALFADERTQLHLKGRGRRRNWRSRSQKSMRSMSAVYKPVKKE
ncbi:MAG: hypothetical protein RIE84_11290 [Parvibaculum sp.]|uniref:hypothetical protein n=1 Tax=Parvibaculum sp. TaxID=2024848 RepID=UPI0032EC18B6